MNLTQIDEKMMLIHELLDHTNSNIYKLNEMKLQLENEKNGFLKELTGLLEKRKELMK